MTPIIYGIGGLGADERVYKYLELDYRFVFLPWISPEKKEPLGSYARRFAASINQDVPFVVMGVSFGGLLAVELGKFLKPEGVILISSAATRFDLKSIYLLAGRTGIIPYIPSAFLQLPPFVLHFLFSAKNKALLSQIVNDTDKQFMKWALQALTTWSNEVFLERLVKIHGTKDRLIPFKGGINIYEIENAGHFMVVDRAQEVRLVIHKIMKDWFDVGSD